MTFVPTQLSTVFFQAKNSGVVGSQSRVAKKLKLDSLVNLTKDNGILPVNWLLFRLKIFKLDKLPKDEGIKPVN